MEGDRRYISMRVRVGQSPPLTPGEVLAGRQWQGMEAPLREAYLKDRITRAERALEGLRRSRRLSDRSRLLDMEAALEDLTRMKEEWETWQT